MVELPPPFVTKTTSGAKACADGDRVRVVGKVTRASELDDGQLEFTIQDPEGELVAFIPASTFHLEPGLVVRAFGTVRKIGGGNVVIDAAFVQDASSLDLDLYYKVLELVGGATSDEG
ncbi:MAG: hypothetical protein Kow0069_08210 [Promethearchaeota archaeon]